VLRAVFHLVPSKRVEHESLELDDENVRQAVDAQLFRRLLMSLAAEKKKKKKKERKKSKRKTRYAQHNKRETSNSKKGNTNKTSKQQCRVRHC